MAGAFTLAQASLGQQQVSAATKNYTVTVKYVGSDKKTLKTQKVKLASGKIYTPQRYTFKNYTSPKSIAKVKVNGNKTVTVKYNHVVAKQVKKSSQANVNLKFNFKGSDGRNFGSKTVQVPKGQSYTYVVPKDKELAKNNNQANYYTDSDLVSAISSANGDWKSIIDGWNNVSINAIPATKVFSNDEYDRNDDSYLKFGLSTDDTNFDSINTGSFGSMMANYELKAGNKNYYIVQNAYGKVAWAPKSYKDSQSYNTFYAE